MYDFKIGTYLGHYSRGEKLRKMMMYLEFAGTAKLGEGGRFGKIPYSPTLKKFGLY